MALAGALIVLLFSSFLIVIGAFMSLKPISALGVLRHMGSTPTIHFSELSVRFLVGAGVYIFAAQSHFTQAFQITGIFLMVTSLMIMCVPHRIHNAYSVWWADRFPPALVRALGLIPIALGMWLFAHVTAVIA